MWLRNFYHLLAWAVVGKCTYGTDVVDSELNVQNYTGSFFDSFPGGETKAPIYYLFPALNLDVSSPFGSLTYNSNGIRFGSGDTPVTYNDCNLEQPLVAGASTSNLVLQTPAYDETTRTWSNTISMDIKNTGVSDLTVKEVGFFGYGTLLYREVLDTPFTISVGQTVHYTHKFSFTMPEHS